MQVKSINVFYYRKSGILPFLKNDGEFMNGFQMVMEVLILIGGDRVGR